MADLLRSGATMLSDVCPECNTVLFKMKDEVICPKCNRPVVMVKATEDEAKVLGERALVGVEQTLVAKILDAEALIKKESDVERSIQLGTMLSNWLTALERLKRIRQSPT